MHLHAAFSLHALVQLFDETLHARCIQACVCTFACRSLICMQDAHICMLRHALALFCMLCCMLRCRFSCGHAVITVRRPRPLAALAASAAGEGAWGVIPAGIIPALGAHMSQRIPGLGPGGLLLTVLCTGTGCPRVSAHACPRICPRSFGPFRSLSLLPVYYQRWTPSAMARGSASTPRL